MLLNALVITTGVNYFTYLDFQHGKNRYIFFLMLF